MSSLFIPYVVAASVLAFCLVAAFVLIYVVNHLDSEEAPSTSPALSGGSAEPEKPGATHRSP
jgi:hypothetical protein